MTVYWETLMIIPKHFWKESYWICVYIIAVFAGENVIQFVVSSDISQVFKQLSANIRENINLCRACLCDRHKLKRV